MRDGHAVSGAAAQVASQGGACVPTRQAGRRRSATAVGLTAVVAAAAGRNHAEAVLAMVRHRVGGAGRGLLQPFQPAGAPTTHQAAQALKFEPWLEGGRGGGRLSRILLLSLHGSRSRCLGGAQLSSEEHQLRSPPFYVDGIPWTVRLYKVKPQVRMHLLASCAGLPSATPHAGGGAVLASVAVRPGRARWALWDSRLGLRGVECAGWSVRGLGVPAASLRLASLSNPSRETCYLLVRLARPPWRVCGVQSA
jgi:hypothetical protein